MADLILPNAITSGEIARASDVRGNFEAVTNHANAELVPVDGTRGFEVLPTGPSDVDATSAGHLVTKGYLDRRQGLVFHREFTTTTSVRVQNTTHTSFQYTHNFTFPSIPEGSFFRVDVQVPVTRLSNQGGFPPAYAAYWVHLYTNDTRIMSSRHFVSGGRGFVNPMPGAVMSKVWTSNTIAAGASRNINIRGSWEAAPETGGFYIEGTTERPITITGTLG